MLSLRLKLTVAFAGLFLLLASIAGFSITLIDGVSSTFERIFRENLLSIEASGAMRIASEALGETVRERMQAGQTPGGREIDSLREEFERRLRFQQGNVTLPGEQAMTDSLTQAWRRLADALDLAQKANPTPTSDGYRQAIRPNLESIWRHTQAIAALNSANMLSTDGQVKLHASKTRGTLTLLLTSSALLIALLLFGIARLILNPISVLTRSVQEIERGNLDLVLQVRSRDELGELATAFNAMAARLREFRRSDRARFLRAQKATQVAINSLPDAVAVLSLGGEVEMANDSAIQFFGIKPGTSLDMLGQPWLQSLFATVMRELRPYHPQGYENARQIFLDGKERFFLPHAIPILDESKEVSGLTLILADVTQLRRLDEAKSDLLATVSHEFKTRLTSVRMAVHLLLGDKLGELNDKQAELLVTARDDSERLYRIIEGLLDIGRIRSGSLQMQPKAMEAGAWMRRVVDGYRHLLQDKGLRLVERFPGEDADVWADPARIDLVLENLLSNAVKYTPPGGEITVGYEASSDEGERGVVFKVSDTGIGIPEAELPRIFERFYRGARLDVPDGAGLGLAIAKEIVEAHGGHMSVTSSLGQGSTFIFTLKRPPAGEA
jgi:two-component system, NtrC family, sensor histidine kinase KinB